MGWSLGLGARTVPGRRVGGPNERRREFERVIRRSSPRADPRMLAAPREAARVGGVLNADEVADGGQENTSKAELHSVLRTDLDHTAHTFLGYSDDAKRRRKVDGWMRKPDAIDWQAEIDEARRHGQEVRFGQEEAEQVRLLLGEHLPV
jgi:hypothetical protein